MAKASAAAVALGLGLIWVTLQTAAHSFPFAPRSGEKVPRKRRMRGFFSGKHAGRRGDAESSVQSNLLPVEGRGEGKRGGIQFGYLKGLGSCLAEPCRLMQG